MTDTIVIFGCGVQRDGSTDPTLRRGVEAALARLLREADVPSSRILPEPTAHNTLASVHACAGLLRSQIGGEVWAATSFYHLPRCAVLLRLAGLSARAWPPSISAHEWWQAACWWGRGAVASLPWARRRRRTAQSAA